jgi:hypothetical protein
MAEHLAGTMVAKRVNLIVRLNVASPIPKLRLGAHRLSPKSRNIGIMLSIALSPSNSPGHRDEFVAASST